MWETEPSLPQSTSASASFKPEEDMLESCSLQTLNWHGVESQLFRIITRATKIHGIARILKNSTNRVLLKLLYIGCRLQWYSYSTFEIGRDCDPTSSTSRDLILSCINRGSLSLLCPCAQKSSFSSPHSPWLNARLLPSHSFKLLPFKHITCLI